MKYVIALSCISNLKTIFVLDEPPAQDMAEQLFSSMAEYERKMRLGNSQINLDINMDHT